MRGWSIDSFIGEKEPFMLAVCGSMKQQEIARSFLGTVVEEKFHVNAFSILVLPCVPLIPERIKHMVHPDISPTQIEESGSKNGYYLVNLSLRQEFNPPEFQDLDGKEKSFRKTL